MENWANSLNRRVSVPLSVVGFLLVVATLGMTFFVATRGNDDIVGAQLGGESLTDTEQSTVPQADDAGTGADSGRATGNQNRLRVEGDVLVVETSQDDEAVETLSSTTSSSTTSSSTPSTTVQTTTSAPATTTSSTSSTAPPTTPTTNGQDGNRDRTFEQQVIELTNQHRRQAGCSDLTNNNKLHQAALAHSVDMETKNYFSHTSADGSQLRDRINRQGYNWSGIGENIAAGQRTPEEVVTAWMNSSGHRANILRCAYTEIGVGFYNYYWTQNFGTPRGGATPTSTPPTSAPPTTSPTTVAPPSSTASSTAPPTTPTTNGQDGNRDRTFEQQVIELTNQHRRQAGCSDLTNNNKLHQAALAHSVDMETKNYFSHTSADGSQLRDRINRQGYNWSGIGENIAAGQRTPEEVVTAWMNSSGHRANILRCAYTEIGVGFYNYYWTQNFGTPR